MVLRNIHKFVSRSKIYPEMDALHLKAHSKIAEFIKCRTGLHAADHVIFTGLEVVALIRTEK